MRSTTFVMQNICYKMKFLIYWGMVVARVKQRSFMHKQTTLKDIIQPLNFIKINI